MKTLTQIGTELTRAGISYKRVNICSGPETLPAIMASHDYAGTYPSAETWKTICAVDKIAKRNKSERRGYYTATLIYEIPA